MAEPVVFTPCWRCLLVSRVVRGGVGSLAAGLCGSERAGRRAVGCPRPSQVRCLLAPPAIEVACLVALPRPAPHHTHTTSPPLRGTLRWSGCWSSTSARTGACSSMRGSWCAATWRAGRWAARARWAGRAPVRRAAGARFKVGPCCARQAGQVHSGGCEACCGAKRGCAVPAGLPPFILSCLQRPSPGCAAPLTRP